MMQPTLVAAHKLRPLAQKSFYQLASSTNKSRGVSFFGNGNRVEIKAAGKFSQLLKDLDVADTHAKTNQISEQLNFQVSNETQTFGGCASPSSVNGAHSTDPPQAREGTSLEKLEIDNLDHNNYYRFRNAHGKSPDTQFQENMLRAPAPRGSGTRFAAPDPSFETGLKNQLLELNKERTLKKKIAQ